MSIDKLRLIMDRLRDPEYGCPWDCEQTPQSLTRYTLEEVYEVVDAIENGSSEELKDELGDLLFQIVFYTRIAQERGEFDFTDVAEAISAKLLRRHPHVFPDGSLDSFGQQQTIDAGQVVSNWEDIKKRERAGQAKNEKEVSVLADVPVALPALKRSLKLQKRAAGVGFDWEQASQVLSKVREELAELEEEMDGGESAAVEAEVGDLLFAVVNLARHLDVEPESALRAANRKFIDRFEYIEGRLSRRGVKPESTSLEEMERLWNEAKQNGL